MTAQEAAKISGFAVFTIQMFARQGKFGACKPRGNRGGWDIDEMSFRSFLKFRRMSTANDFMQRQIKRGSRSLDYPGI